MNERTLSESDLPRMSHEEATKLLEKWVDDLGCTAPEAFSGKLLNHSMSLAQTVNSASARAFILACNARTLTNHYVIQRPDGERLHVVGRIVGILEYDVQPTEQTK